MTKQETLEKIQRELRESIAANGGYLVPDYSPEQWKREIKYHGSCCDSIPGAFIMMGLLAFSLLAPVFYIIYCILYCVGLFK